MEDQIRETGRGKSVKKNMGPKEDEEWKEDLGGKKRERERPRKTGMSNGINF